ncbi:hypothetical protein DPX39_110057000 [Trypanosoma brucei equiperdum]|uniref:Uncharacterized protein n=1 Tax=Trypanosoma brucei equiperdum TaxID=630700 RepID=A0A3L6KUV9_9TRYP|nr:hypothetical protein DPX39_110057000 [Trypanosoma brucei equiperdum]
MRELPFSISRFLGQQLSTAEWLQCRRTCTEYCTVCDTKLYDE